MSCPTIWWVNTVHKRNIIHIDRFCEVYPVDSEWLVVGLFIENKLIFDTISEGCPLPIFWHFKSRSSHEAKLLLSVSLLFIIYLWVFVYQAVTSRKLGLVFAKIINNESIFGTLFSMTLCHKVYLSYNIAISNG